MLALFNSVCRVSGVDIGNVPFRCDRLGFTCGFLNFRAPWSYPWLLVKLTEGMFSGITGMLQKQGNTEAVPVGRKSVGVTFTSYPKYITIFNNSQYIKNIGILLFIVKLGKNQGKGSLWYKSHMPLPSTAEQPQASRNSPEPLDNRNLQISTAPCLLPGS